MKTPRFGRGALIDLTSTSIPDSDGGPTPSIVEANLHQVQLLLDAGVEDERLGRIGELQSAGVKVEIVVFDLCRPIVEKRVFDAGAYDPAKPGLVPAERGQQSEVRGRQIVLVVRPGDAALTVDQHAIERDAQSTRDRAHPHDLRAAAPRRKRTVEQRG